MKPAAKKVYRNQPKDYQHEAPQAPSIQAPSSPALSPQEVEMPSASSALPASQPSPLPVLPQESALPTHTASKKPKLTEALLPTPVPACPQPQGPPLLTPPLHPLQGVDTNVAEICMEELTKENAQMTGEPIFCEGCGSIFNKFSKFTRPDEKQLWVCEFCGTENTLSIDEEQIPTESRLVYQLEPATESTHHRLNDFSSVIFCIDVSGSMCVTTKVPSNFQLKPSKVSPVACEIEPDIGPQLLPGERVGDIHVSRLQCVQAAIEQHINEMALATPKKHVGLVTFNDEVRIIGDGTVVLRGEQLDTFHSIALAVNDLHCQVMHQPIAESVDELKAQVLALEESGGTALGPALLSSVMLAGQGLAGSKVILCTDGIANIGIGKVEEEADQEEARTFYDQVMQLAQEKAVAVSVISLTAEECCISSLARIADNTGGALVKVDPARVSEDFASILSQEFFATQAVVTVNLHKSLVFRNQDHTHMFNNGARLIKQISNVTENTVFTFEYEFRSAEDDNLNQVPFQITVDHRNMNGIRNIFVDTQVLEVDNNLQELVTQADFEVISNNCKVTTAVYASLGRYAQALSNAHSWQQYMVANASSLAQKCTTFSLMSDLQPVSEQLMVINEEATHHSTQKTADQLSVGLNKLARKRTQ